MKKIILASASPRRQELLSKMGIDFKVIPSTKDESMPFGLTAEETVIKLAEEKAIDVAERLKGDYVVVGADTLVVKDAILGKPKDKAEAKQMLERLQGQIHEVITGIVVIDCSNGNILKDYEKTQVHFAQLSDKEIDAYIETGEPFDKAGAYGIQGLAGVFIREICGCYYNVVGLPIHKLWTMLKKTGIDSI